MKQSQLREQPLDELIAVFLTNLAHENRSQYTRHTYAQNLVQFCAFDPGSVNAVTTEVLRIFFGMLLHLSPATRARKQPTVACFLAWAHQHEVLGVNFMLKLVHEKLDLPLPHAMKLDHIEHILKLIPTTYQCDQLFFRLLLETGLRLSEGLSVYVEENIDLSLDNEHLTVVGKGGKRRTILLADPHLMHQRKTYLKRMDCTQSRIVCTLHQFRHIHTTELISGGFILPSIRKWVGHNHLQTALRYAEQFDETINNELPHWRRQQCLRFQ